jgi:hypothetical protein
MNEFSAVLGNTIADHQYIKKGREPFPGTRDVTETTTPGPFAPGKGSQPLMPMRLEQES